MTRLQEKFNKEVVPLLMKRFGYKNPMQVPRLAKMVVNCGVGEAMQNAKLLEATLAELGAITGQKPAIRRAKKAISNFKLKVGEAIAGTVTLRGAKMYEFLDRLANVAVPRIRNAAKARQKTVDVPSSRLKKEIVRVLLEQRFIKNFVEVPNPRQNLLRIFLSYTPEKKSFITGLVRLSKPGLRMYLTNAQLHKMSQAMGTTLLSSSQGVLTDQQARQKGVGGEALCRVW